MKYQWMDKNIDSKALVEAIESFLRGKKFEIRRDDSEDSSRILAVLRTAENEIRRVLITTSGSPKDFAVELTIGDQDHLIPKLASLVSLFGGGSLILKKQQSAEFYQKFEEQFWRYLESKI